MKKKKEVKTCYIDDYLTNRLQFNDENYRFLMGLLYMLRGREREDERELFNVHTCRDIRLFI